MSDVIPSEEKQLDKAIQKSATPGNSRYELYELTTLFADLIRFPEAV